LRIQTILFWWTGALEQLIQHCQRSMWHQGHTNVAIGQPRNAHVLWMLIPPNILRSLPYEW
jgi:hypothetical protein